MRNPATHQTNFVWEEELSDELQVYWMLNRARHTRFVETGPNTQSKFFYFHYKKKNVIINVRPD